MILSGKEINRLIDKEIFIDPYQEENLNPNSYNVTLHNQLLVYKNALLDMKEQLQTEEITIPPEGYVIKPEILYLGRTVEKTHTDYYVPVIDGRSSLGRLGINIHVTAGFGDIGFDGTWTLQLSCIQPVRIYPHIQVGRIMFFAVVGEYDLYKNKYQGQEGIGVSKLHEELNGPSKMFIPGREKRAR